jgi:hypothetical protein
MIEIGDIVKYAKLKNCVVIMKDSTHVVIEYDGYEGKREKLCTPISGFKENDIIIKGNQKSQLEIF